MTRPRVARVVATWSDVFWRWLHKGVPREEAAYRADQWEQRGKPAISAVQNAASKVKE